jgi:hypothetical protein
LWEKDGFDAIEVGESVCGGLKGGAEEGEGAHVEAVVGTIIIRSEEGFLDLESSLLVLLLVAVVALRGVVGAAAALLQRLPDVVIRGHCLLLLLSLDALLLFDLHAYFVRGETFEALLFLGRLFFCRLVGIGLICEWGEVGSKLIDEVV